MEAIRQNIRDQSDIIQVILAADKYASETGFKKDDVEAIKTSVSELAYNILKYAGSGLVSLRRVKLHDRKGIEICAKDDGPGIPDLNKAMTDHYSTGKTLGLGLPGVKRLLDDFQVETAPGQGTTVTGHKWL